MPLPLNIIHTAVDSPEIFEKIYNYYGINSVLNAPKNSIYINSLRFVKNNVNDPNDYILINFVNDRFHSWNKPNWFMNLYIQFFGKQFELKRSQFDFLKNTYNAAWDHFPTILHTIYYKSGSGKFIIFFFELFDGPGGGGNSTGVKVPGGQ